MFSSEVCNELLHVRPVLLVGHEEHLDGPVGSGDGCVAERENPP